MNSNKCTKLIIQKKFLIIYSVEKVCIKFITHIFSPPKIKETPLKLFNRTSFRIKQKFS